MLQCFLSLTCTVVVDQACARSCSIFWDSSVLQDCAFCFHVQLELQAVYRKNNSREQNTSPGVLFTSSQPLIYYFFPSPATFHVFRLQILKGRYVKIRVYILYTLDNIMHNIICIIISFGLYFCMFIIYVIYLRNVSVY